MKVIYNSCYGEAIEKSRIVSEDFITNLERENLDTDQLINQPYAIQMIIDKSWVKKLKVLD